ncbi:uncharacterized protein LOC123685479 isoform X1 [Harmonia axyridis]|uniref:uncharacterized protein LOC123685479 isoform X1 n=1 Tax=Harmonia axyridis TaxID=115357 RepID=UPI001E274F8F|nr:uncharacterized protein LOC123685479 isoform X1 [Harmonia axyridis]
MNHFETCCIKKKFLKSKKREVNEINEEFIDSDSSDNFLLETVNIVETENDIVENISELNIINEITENVKINDKIVCFKVDTGAQCNILPANVFQSLIKSKKSGSGLQINKNQKVNLVAYGGCKLDVRGSIHINCNIRNKVYNLKFLIVEEQGKPILGLEISMKCNLIDRHDFGISPAQLLLSRRLKDDIPVMDHLLQPIAINKKFIREKFENRRLKQKNYYNRHVKNLAEGKIGDRVLFKYKNVWKEGKIVNLCEEPRSYHVIDIENRIFRRTRQHIILLNNSYFKFHNDKTNEGTWKITDPENLVDINRARFSLNMCKNKHDYNLRERKKINFKE